MSRYVWINSKELHDRHAHSICCYSEEDEGLIYDTQEKEVVLDFGNNECYYPTCGTAPNEHHLKIIMDALNAHTCEVIE